MIERYKKYEPLFGEWKISRLIGKGSFGEVYEIERDNFGTTYKAALKAISIPVDESELNELMSSGMSVAETKQYIKQSAKDIVNEFVLMSKLKGNTNIVSYEDHQVIEHEDQLGWDILMKMELLQPVNEYIKANGFTEKDLVKLGIDLCTAIELCEKHHIVHRDIKPENIFVSPNGDFKLGDFGIARSIERATLGLSKKGTYSYMAPEVYKGENYTEKVDIYSLGIVMYKLMNHSRIPLMPKYPNPVAYSDREQALIKRMNGEKLPLPSSSGNEKLAQIALKACEYEPDQRYDNATQMKEDLESLLENVTECALLSPAKKTEEVADQPKQKEKAKSEDDLKDGKNLQNKKSSKYEKVLRNEKKSKDENPSKNEKPLQNKQAIKRGKVSEGKSEPQNRVEEEDIEKTLLLDREELTHSNIENKALEGTKKKKMAATAMLAITCTAGLIAVGGLILKAYTTASKDHVVDQLQDLSSANFISYSKSMLENIQIEEEPQATAKAISEAAVEAVTEMTTKETDQTKEEKEAAEKEKAKKEAELAEKAAQEKAKEEAAKKKAQASSQNSTQGTVKESTQAATKETPKEAEAPKKQAASSSSSDTQSSTHSNGQSQQTSKPAQQQSQSQAKQPEPSKAPAVADAPPEIYLDFNEEGQ